jgi:hypothetical protein
MAISQEVCQDLRDAALPPEALEDQRRADEASTCGDGLPISVSAQDGVLVREPAEGVEQGIELPGSEQIIEPTQTVENALVNLAVDALVLDDDEVGAVAVGLSTDEQEAVSFVSSPSYFITADITRQ